MNFVRNVLAFVVLACSPSLSAQQITGNIRGTITDPSGAVIRDAAVTGLQAVPGLSRSATTDRNGSYVLLELLSDTTACKSGRRVSRSTCRMASRST